MSTKISQEELRKLMKQKRESLKSQKVDSPFAKYSSTGQLSCIICNTMIKSSNLWVTHIIGKTHKENLQKGKKDNDVTTKVNVKLGVKRTAESTDSPKRVKGETFKVPDASVSTTHKTSNILASYSSSNDESDDNEEIKSPNKTSSVINETKSLPPDFFDNTTSNGISSQPLTTVNVEQKDSKEIVTNKTESLPEGFFDDPILDAKARNIEYKDPVEEEWERFKKSIAEETSVSKSIIEEDLEESILERGINQIDEQIHHWERKIGLESLADNVKAKISIKDGNEDESGSTDDDLNEDDLLDWRLKSIKQV